MTIDIKKILRIGTVASGQNRRSAGDAARDLKDWPVAELQYSAHLDSFPDDQPIWVQYGHSLKEQKKLAEAERAYRQAIELNPNDADAHFQLGTALSLLGTLDLAEEAYRSSLDITPSKAAHDALMNLSSIDSESALPSTSIHDASDTVYLEVDDLLDYLRTHKTLSGIQRVQVGVIDFALKQVKNHEKNYAFIRTGKHASGFWKLDPDDVSKITAYVCQPIVSNEKLLSLIEFAEQRAVRVVPSSGQMYFVLGAFWGFGSNAARYTRLKMAGVSVGVYIYDLIPITHPEYCVSGLVNEFSLALSDGLHAFDFVLTISEFVAQEVRKFQAKHKLRPVPVQAVLLAHQLNDWPQSSQPTIWKGSIAPLKNKPFVLMVSTIEARKNHIYLYYIWKQLLDEGLDPPDLVFVGRFGWRVNDLRDMLQGTGYLGKRVHVLHDLSDSDLELLYKSCMFTAFPSIVEGWGLPVGESLAQGRPCIASATSAIPEVGGDLVDYIDPWNVNDGLKTFKKMIFDEEYRSKRVKDIEERFVARTWDQVGKELLTCLETLRPDFAITYSPPLLAAGEVFAPGEMAVGTIVPTNYPSRPLRPIVAESWYPIEPFGTWMRGQEGFLRFSSNSKPGTRVVVYLHLVGPPWSVDHMVSLAIDDQSGKSNDKSVFPSSVRQDQDSLRIDTKKGFLARVSGFVAEDGTVLIRCFVTGERVDAHPAKSSHDDRVFYVGLAKICYAEASDTELRVDIMERFSSLT